MLLVFGVLFKLRATQARGPGSDSRRGTETGLPGITVCVYALMRLWVGLFFVTGCRVVPPLVRGAALQA